jgi:hypothetical protein
VKIRELVVLVDDVDGVEAGREGCIMGLRDDMVQVFAGLNLTEIGTCHSNRSIRRTRMRSRVGDLRRFLWDFTYLCWANPSHQFQLQSGKGRGSAHATRAAKCDNIPLG